ncbi:hypothetical protein KEM60_01542 [Austwickia sp. TVS 96-490-7B]|nr:hypothetical protein [Austwickia sp. TVS 96-490-7B]
MVMCPILQGHKVMRRRALKEDFSRALAHSTGARQVLMSWLRQAVSGGVPMGLVSL